MARLAEYLIENAKISDHLVVEMLVQGERNFDDAESSKLRKVYEVLLPRYVDQDGKYLDMFQLHWTAMPKYKPIRGKLYKKQQQREEDPNNPHKNRILAPNAHGYCVVEFKGNNLPPILPPQEELEQLTLEHFTKKRDEGRILREGVKY